jgi:hypothetical protein
MTKISKRLEGILLDLLQAAHLPKWAGGDALTVMDVIDIYPDAVAAGAVPGWQELLDRYPQFCDEIQTLRMVKGWLDEPLPSVQPLGDLAMQHNDRELELLAEPSADCRLSRWLVSFASGAGWYPVGEFLALDANGAIERAVEVFGPGLGYQAEEIPWDAAPLSRANRLVAV